MIRPLTFGLAGAAVCLLVVGASACAQTVRTDAGSGDRIISYEVDGTRYDAVVPGNDRINPEIRLVSIVAAQAGMRYTYRLYNRTGGVALPDRGLWMADIPCRGVLAGRLASVSNDWLADLVPAAGGGICRFSTLAAREMQPGDSSSLLTIESRFLPAFVTGRAYGVAGPHAIPTDEEYTPDTLRRLIVQLRVPGGLASGREVSVVAPFVAPEALAGPITVVQMMRSDLAAMCGQLGWITNRGVCQSLETKIGNAEAALLNDEGERARQVINAFANEVRAQRGKHIPEQGYAMLMALRTYLESEL